MFCAGCPHRGVFYELGKLPVVITGDIGCYTLGRCRRSQHRIPAYAWVPASRRVSDSRRPLASWTRRTREERLPYRDSTFYHSGMTGLLDAVYNGVGLVTVILDNRITAMTGHQENPARGGMPFQARPRQKLNQRRSPSVWNQAGCHCRPIRSRSGKEDA